MFAGIYFKELPFPSIPEELSRESRITDEVMEEKQTSQANSKSRRTDVKVVEDGQEKTVGTAFYAAKSVFNKQVAEWVTDNIPFLKEFPTSYKLAEQVSWGAKNHTPHVDRNRLSQLLIVLEPGGDAVQTSWYQEPGEPEVRTEYMGNIQDATNLKEVCTATLKPNTWYFFNSKIIHGVRNIEGKRRAICINLLDEDILKHLEENYLRAA